MATLSLCLIARDEARFLGDCLASSRASVDELVVVDTGSRDGTREIARSLGAKVVDFAWCDDFAAARNAALDAATGTHVLVLDADERLVDPHGALRRAAEDARFTIGLLPLHDANALDAQTSDVLSGRARLWDPCLVPRFFVRDPVLRFTRRVHETILADVKRLNALLQARHSRIVALDAAIVHLGEVPELRAARGKRARNTKLLERALADDPADGDLAGYLATELAREGEFARARALGETHLWPFLETLRGLPRDSARPSPVQLASVLATCLVQDGELERALEVVHQSQACCLEAHPNLAFLEGAALERLGRVEEARRAYETCLAADGRPQTIPVNPGATNAAPRQRLANLALAAGDPHTALAHLDAQASWTGPFEVPAVLLRAEAWLQLGDAPRALAALSGVLARPGAPPDLFALASDAAARLGAADPSLRDTARRMEVRRWIEPRRRALVERD